jgi:hypothetical protein
MDRVAQAMASSVAGSEQIRDVEVLLLRALAPRDSVLHGQPAFDAVAPHLLPLLERPAGELRSQRAGYVLASLSTPSATVALIQAIEDGLYQHAESIRNIRDPGSAGILRQALDRFEDGPTSRAIVAALTQCGPEGARELRDYLSAGSDRPMYGTVLLGFVRMTASSEDLLTLERVLSEFPHLRAAVESEMGVSDFEEQRADAFVRYLISGRASLRTSISKTLAGWNPVDTAPCLELLRSESPDSHREVVRIREESLAQRLKWKRRMEGLK